MHDDTSYVLQALVESLSEHSDEDLAKRKAQAERDIRDAEVDVEYYGNIYDAIDEIQATRRAKAAFEQREKEQKKRRYDRSNDYYYEIANAVANIRYGDRCFGLDDATISILNDLCKTLAEIDYPLI